MILTAHPPGDCTVSMYAKDGVHLGDITNQAPLAVGDRLLVQQYDPANPYDDPLVHYAVTAELGPGHYAAQYRCTQEEALKLGR